MSANMEFAIFLIVVGLPGVMSVPVCPPPFVGGRVLNTNGDPFYLCMVSPVVEASWIEAQAWCNLVYNAFLAMIFDSTAQNAIEDYLLSLNRTNNDFWLAGIDTFSSDTWYFKWPYSSVPVDEYEDWGVGFPRAYGNKNCMYMTTNARAEGTWGNAACNEKKQFVCT